MSHRHRLVTPCVLAIMLALFVAGCGGTSGGFTSREAAPAYDTYTTEESDATEDYALGAAASDDVAAKKADNGANDNSVIIRSAFVSLKSRDYDGALDAIRAVLDKAGAKQVSSNESGGYSRSITIDSRVDPKKLEQTVEELRKLDGCTVMSANISADDVTRTYNDTERRIEILNEQYEHYKKMLEEAETTEDILAISDRMYEVMAEIKSYTDSRDEMKHNADHSMLSVTLTEETTSGGAPSSPGSFAADAWEDSWGIFGQVIRSIVYLFIMLIPYLLIAAVIVGIVLIVRRRHPKSARKKKDAEATDNDPQTAQESLQAKRDDGPKPPL